MTIRQSGFVKFLANGSTSLLNKKRTQISKNKNKMIQKKLLKEYLKFGLNSYSVF